MDVQRDEPSRGGVPDRPGGGTPDRPSGVSEPPDREPDERAGERDPHHALNNPARDPDATEWPDPYDRRADPRYPADPDEEPFGEEPHAPTGSRSTSEPHPSQDPEAGDRWEGPKRDKLDR